MYGKFSYTKATHEAKLGPLDLSVKDNQMVNVPLWAGVGVIVVGALLLLVRFWCRSNYLVSRHDEVWAIQSTSA